MFTVLAVLIIGKGFFVYEDNSTVVQGNDWELLYEVYNLEDDFSLFDYISPNDLNEYNYVYIYACGCQLFSGGVGIGEDKSFMINLKKQDIQEYNTIFNNNFDFMNVYVWGVK